MKQLNDKLDGLSELVTRIDAKILDINTKLDELIKALHEYDDDLSTFEDEPQSGPCSKHDAEQWNEERMDIIGQNGNEGLHYDEPEFDDYGRRVDKDKDKSNNSANIRVSKPLVEGENKSGSKGDTGKTQAPPPPKPPKPKRKYYHNNKK
jgi:hypothetical protein